jgi:hypothetical protein
VAVENHGAQTWPWGFVNAPEIRVAYRWLAPDGEVRVAEGLRTPLPGPVRPGERAVVEAGVAAPGPGAYLLELDLVHEHVRWFGAAVRVPVTVA